MSDLEKAMYRKDICRARQELLEMLSELSDDVLVYVWRPIAYAYYWSDAHNQEILTDEDINRLELVGDVAHAKSERIAALAAYSTKLFQEELQARREGQYE